MKNKNNDWEETERERRKKEKQKGQKKLMQSLIYFFARIKTKIIFYPS